MKIEVWSDFVCPFCYIGKRRFEAALENFPHNKKVYIEYKSYQLDPNAENNPGKKMHELLASKYGISVEKAVEMNASVGEQAADVGLKYDFENMQHTNTFDAHRLAKYAIAFHKGQEMTERLLKAYFTDSELISDHPTLIRLAGEVGLNKEEVEAFLQTCKFTKAVQFDQEQAREIGVQGVPFFVFNEKYAISGAQPVDAFTEVLEKVWEEENEQPISKSLNPKNTETTYCCDGEKNCMEV